MESPSGNLRPSSSLFDRLVSDDDDAPQVMLGQRMTRRHRTTHLEILRGQIERDLLDLLGTRRMSAGFDLSAWPRIEKSVLNYGIPDLSGSTGSSIDVRQLQRQLTKVIKWFEPRLQPDTLSVTCKVKDYAARDVLVEIEAMFGVDDELESFAMGVSICLGSGQCRAA